jgi:poly-gamma-glutamate synthesis protein (capsule biosynthesis protein)
MLGRGVAQALGEEWERALAPVAPALRAAGLACVNLESPLTSAPFAGGRHDLRAPPRAIAALTSAGVDCVSLANNHALDGGQAGLTETLEVLHVSSVTGVTQDGLFCRAGMCLLALDDSTAPLDVRAAGEAIAQAEAAFVIVSIHWGGEYQAAPTLRQQALARAFAAAGADLVVGHGPHVLQRVEEVEGAVVAYSLGNLLFDQPYPADCRQGAILLVDVCDGRIQGVEVIPTESVDGQVLVAGPDAAAAIHARLDPRGSVLRRSHTR